jgi:hypothetical protein
MARLTGLTGPALISVVLFSEAESATASNMILAVVDE